MTQPAKSSPAVCCEGKDPLTAERAKEIASRMCQRGKRVSAYRCSSCAFWHVGQALARSLGTRRALRRREGQGV